MKFPSISSFLRLALLRALMRVGGFVLRRAMAPAMRPATASARHTEHTSHNPHTATAGRVIDGEYRRIDPRHNNSW